jgi:mono/diheme cytochrome c family protein
MKSIANKLTLIALFFGVAVIALTAFKWKSETGTYRVMNMDQAPVDQVLITLGDDRMIHSMDMYDPEKAKMGEDLILYGRTKVNGKYSKRISKHFVCTDCHNLGREFKNMSSEDASERLKYSEENGLAFLPGSTLWGIYNRTSFYNNDYEKKYGSLVVDSRDTLANAVQLCTEYCSAGRHVEDWELDALMHYFKKNQLKIKDLGLTANQLKNLQRSSKLTTEEKTDLMKVIKDSYRQAYSATFLETMSTDKRQYGAGGNAENGKTIYNKSCLHCHGGGRVTYLSLNNSKLNARMFWRNIKNYSDKSLYQIIRHGTYSKAGRKQYMPLYTKEKMSDEQLNDLVAYIKQIAGK